MNQKYKTPKADGAGRIKEIFDDQRRKQPSEALLEILKKKSNKKQERPDKKVAKPFRRSTDVEL